MAVSNVVVGAVTPTSASVRAKITEASAQLVVATDPALTSPMIGVDTAPATDDGMVALDVTGLTPGTQYWYGVQEPGGLDTGHQGTFRTHPVVGEPASFTFLASSCAGENTTDSVGDVLLPNRMSNRPSFDTIRLKALAENALFFAHLGDMHYYNIFGGGNPETAVGSIDMYRRAYDDVFLQPLQAALYRDVPVVYIWDDHDAGPNNADSTNPGRLMVAQVYREKFPSYPLPDGGACFHSFQIGRVLFLCTDSRFYRTPDTEPDDADKSMLGAQQKAWLRGVLASSDAKALVLVHQMQWTGSAVVDGDSWRGFTTERAELGALFVELGWAEKMIIIGGDSHRLSMDTGANNPDGGFPSYCFGAIESGANSGPQDGTGIADLGMISTWDGYGVFDVADTGEQITITTTAYIDTAVWNTHTLTVQTPQAAQQSGGKIAPHYTWYAGSLVDGRITTQIPQLSSTWSEVLNDAGQLQLVATLADPDMQALNLYVAAEPCRCFLAVSYTDEQGTETFLEAGPIWVADWDAGSTKHLTLGAAGLWSYWDHRRVLPVLLAGQSPADVTTEFVAAKSAQARRLVQQAQSHTGGHVPVVLPPEETGSNKRSWPGYEMHVTGDELRTLTKDEGGPEIAFVPRRHPDDGRFLQWLMNIGTTAAPMLTQLGADHIFDGSVVKSQISGLTVKREGTDMADRVWVQGAGTDKETLFARADDQALIAAGFPLLEMLDSEHSGEKGAKLSPTLNGYAQGDLALSRRPVETRTITVRRDGETDDQGKRVGPTVGAYRPGHWVSHTTRGDEYLPDGTYRSRIVGKSGDQTLDVQLQLAPTQGGI